MRYDETGAINRASAAELKSISDRIEREDAERARNRRAWDRLCGMASPIGRAVDLPEGR